VLAAEHAIVASRFSSAGRPSARHLLESVPWTRAAGSGAIVLDGGLAALDCRLDRLVEAGDHVLALLEVEACRCSTAVGRPAAAAARPLRRRVRGRARAVRPRPEHRGAIRRRGCHIRGPAVL
jgi:flavin reductase (DIM6/NTAB) family NADH-FMN oxidoreductase RutF